MKERHEHEQYFFDSPTLDRLVDFVRPFDNPCCLCAPLLGKTLVDCGVNVRILDIDERFADVPGFQHFDLTQPEWLGERFGLIFCDPPFFNVSLRQLSSAIRLLSQHDVQQPLGLTYLHRREAVFLRTFSDLNLQPTDFFPTYTTVAPDPKNDIRLYTNLDAPRLALLQAR